MMANVPDQSPSLADGLASVVNDKPGEFLPAALTSRGGSAAYLESFSGVRRARGRRRLARRAAARRRSR